MTTDDWQTFADRSLREGKITTALVIYLRLAEDDLSLDGGSVAHAIGECYERLGDLPAARYWYSRARTENPSIELYQRDFARMSRVGLADLAAQP